MHSFYNNSVNSIRFGTFFVLQVFYNFVHFMVLEVWYCLGGWGLVLPGRLGFGTAWEAGVW